MGEEEEKGIWWPRLLILCVTSECSQFIIPNNFISLSYLLSLLHTPTKNKISSIMVRGADWSAWMGWAQARVNHRSVLIGFEATFAVVHHEPV